MLPLPSRVRILYGPKSCPTFSSSLSGSRRSGSARLTRARVQVGRDSTTGVRNFKRLNGFATSRQHTPPRGYVVCHLSELEPNLVRVSGSLREGRNNEGRNDYVEETVSRS